MRYGTRIFTETVTSVDFGPHAHAHTADELAAMALQRGGLVGASAPGAAGSGGGRFTLWTDTKRIVADTVIVATGAGRARARAVPRFVAFAARRFQNRAAPSVSAQQERQRLLP